MAQLIPVPQKDKNGKIMGSFYPLQKAELIALKKTRIINNAAFVHLALRSENPFCDNPIKIKPKEFALRWGIPEVSVYKAIAKLKELGVISIEAGSAIIRFINTDNELSDLTTDYKDGKSLIKIDNELSDPIVDHQNRKTDTNIDRACDQTLQTNKDSIQTKQTAVDAHEESSSSKESSFQKSDRKSNQQEKADDATLQGQRADERPRSGSPTLGTRKEGSTTPLDKPINHNSTPNQNLDPSLDQSSQACSTVESKKSDKVRAGERPQTVYDRSLEYENRLSQWIPNWDRFTPEQQDILKHLSKVGKNKLEYPWRENGEQYTLGVKEAVINANLDWYSQPKNQGKHIGRLRNLEKAIAAYEIRPLEAIEAYRKMMGYVTKAEDAALQGQRADERPRSGFPTLGTREEGGAESSREELMALFDAALT
ncbi:MAG: hypothetical protein QNJ37_04765 [Crocosphaera sp.]|nr:hypothetical protein [Crocosphaera sp.]